MLLEVEKILKLWSKLLKLHENSKKVRLWMIFWGSLTNIKHLINKNLLALNSRSFLRCVSLSYNHVRQVHFESRRKNDRTIWYPTDALLVIHVELIRLSMPRLALLSFEFSLSLDCLAVHNLAKKYTFVTSHFTSIICNCFLHWLLNATCKLF